MTSRATHFGGRIGPRAACGTSRARQLTDHMEQVTCRRCLAMAGIELFEARTRQRYVSAARRRWPSAEWIIGDGRYASVAYCEVTTVMLFATPAEAQRAKAFIDRLACGHACVTEHEIADLAAAPIRTTTGRTRP